MTHKTHYLILILAVFACGFTTAYADDTVAAVPDIFTEIQAGDDLQITLKNKNVFKGTVEEISDSSIKINISNFDEKMTGFIILNKSQIKKIKHLKALTEKDIESVESRRTIFKEKYSGNITAVSPQKADISDETAKDSKTLLEKFPPDKGWGKEKYNDLLQLAEGKLTEEEKEFLDKYEDWILEKKQAENKKSDDLLKKFPPDKGWGQEKYDSLSLQFATVGTTLTGEEQEFVDKFENWKTAKQTADSSKTTAEKVPETAESQPQPAPTAEKPKEQPKAQPKSETKPAVQPAPDKTGEPAPPSAKPKPPSEPAKSPGPPPLKPPQPPPAQPQPGQ